MLVLICVGLFVFFLCVCVLFVLLVRARGGWIRFDRLLNCIGTELNLCLVNGNC